MYIRPIGKYWATIHTEGINEWDKYGFKEYLTCAYTAKYYDNLANGTPFQFDMFEEIHLVKGSKNGSND